MEKILVIGTLPKEVGGRYTQGICNVVYELSKQPLTKFEVHVLAVNTPDKLAAKINRNDNIHYHGYRTRIISMLLQILLHPFQTFKMCFNYQKISNMSALKALLYYDILKKIIKEEKPVVVHSHCIHLSYLVNIITEGKIPLVVTFHGLFIGKNNRLDVIRKSKKFIDFETGLTDETLERLQKLGFDSESIYKISNGVDESKFQYSESDRNKIRKKLKVQDGQVVFITVASLQERKGQLKFIKKIEKSNLKYQYWILGLGPDFNIIQDYVNQHNLKDSVKLIGYVKNTELYKYYSAADIYAHTSTEEGQSLAEIEAYTTGMKILVSEDLRGTIVNDTSDFSTYCFFDFNDFDYDKIEAWCNKMVLNRGTKHKFDWKIISEEYNKTYIDICKRFYAK